MSPHRFAKSGVRVGLIPFCCGIRLAMAVQSMHGVRETFIVGFAV